MLAAPRCRATAAGVPETGANGSAVVGEAVSSTRYAWPDLTGMVNVELLCGPSTVAPLPLTTVTLWPGHGLRIVIGLFDLDAIATVVGVPLLTCTETRVLCWMKTVPSPVQSDGQAGAIRSSPS